MESLFLLLGTSFYLFLPAYIATSLPLVVAGFHIFENLNIPIDGGLKIGKFRLFGDHKTMRGFLFGIGGGIFISLCQFILAKGNFTVSNEVLDYTNLGQSLSFGLLMSTGSLLGDAIESTIKRQLNIAPGESLIIADQIDYVIGAVLITFPFFTIPLITIGSFIVLAFALYLFSGIFSKVVGMKRKWI